tara:strand:- start:7697 stop:8161 length:465 start_codon:yes stop_codon:yes gene_type:complete
MTLEIKKLKFEDFDELYELLLDVKFPYLPNSKQQTFNILSLSHNHLYGGFFNGKLVLFMCFSENNSKLYFDIACQENYRKKWGTKKVITFIFNTAFNKLGYNEFYTESYSDIAQKAVERIGFKNLTGFYYVINKNAKSVQKYLKYKGRKNETSK